MSATDANRVDVWYVSTKDVTAQRTLDACHALLKEDERRSHAAFYFERNRHEYLLTRALGCGVLASYLGVRPDQISFVRNQWGRPELTPASPVHFNLTNTVHVVACAVAHDREVGVDTEPLDRGDDIIGLAPTVFTEGERAKLAVEPLDARRRRAVQLWTLKEAYMKARGMGMSLPPERMEMQFGEGNASSLHRVMPPIEDEPSRWSFETFTVEDHLLSLCIEKVGRPIEITVRRADLDALLFGG